MTFNPSAPLLLGEEWIPPLSLARALSDDATGWSDIFTAQVTESIESIWLYAQSVPQAGQYVVEAYLLGNEDPGVISPYTAVPSADVANFNLFGSPGVWLAEDLRAINLYLSLGDASNLTFIFSTGFAARYQMAFNSGAFAPGVRPQRVQVIVDIACFGGRATDLGIADSVSNTGFKIATLNYVGRQLFTLDIGTINPFTGAPWTSADINNFAAGGDYSIMLTDPQYVLTPIGEAVDVTLSVPWAADNRLAWSATVDVNPGAGRWVEFPLLAAWNKVAATSYAVVVRRVQSLDVTERGGGGGSLTFGYLDGDPRGCPNAGHRTGRFAISNGFIVGAPVISPDAALAVVYQLGSLAGSLDSQPYVTAGSAHVDGSTVAQQEYTPGSSGSFGRVRAYVAANIDAQTAIHAVIKRRSDDQEMSSEQILTVADLAQLTLDDGSVSGWTLWDFTFATPAALVAGTQYYIDLSAPDEPTGSTVGFQVLYLDTLVLASGNGGDTATFGATGDRATIDGAESPDRDLAVTIAELPAAPTGFAAALTTATRPAQGTLCDVTTLEYVLCSWSPTALGALFGYYQIDRSEDGGVTWVTIAHITSEAVHALPDYTSRRGVPACYRIAVARPDRTRSLWTTMSCVTCNAQGVEWIITSNERPNLTVMYNSDGGDFSFARENNNATERTFFGRDDLVVFRPLEAIGDRFSLPLIIGGAGDCDDPAEIGRVVFDALLAISEANLSSVAVLAPTGRRWYAAIENVQMHEREPARTHWASIEVVEVSPTPPVVDALPGQVFTLLRELVAGHSYTTGTGVTAGGDSIFNIVDGLYGEFSGLNDTPAVDSAIYSDSFVRANGPVERTDTGQVWEESAGSVWMINGNELQLLTNNGGHNTLVADFGTADCMVEFDPDSNNGDGLVLRYVDQNNFLFLVLAPGFVTGTLWERVGGFDTSLGSIAFLSGSLGSKVSVCLKGSTVTVQGAAIGSPNNFLAKFTGVTAGQSATKHGMYGSSLAVPSHRWKAMRVIDTRMPESPLAQQLGMWAVSGGKYELVGQERKGDHFLVKDTGWSDGYVAMVLGATQSNTGLLFRYVNDSNYCYVAVVPGAFAALHKVVGGVDTNIGTFLCPVTPGAKIRVDMFGTRIRVSTGLGYGNVTTQTIADAVFLTATKHGAWINTNVFLVAPMEKPMWSRIYMSRTIGNGQAATTLGAHFVFGRQGGYVKVLQEQPHPLSATDLVEYMWGINDPPSLGEDARALKGWSDSLRSVISRAVSAATYEDTDVSCVYTGTWTTQAGIDRNSGTGWHETATPGDFVTISVVLTEDTMVALGCINVHDDLGATATVRLDGQVVDLINTNGVWVGNVYYGGSCTRIAVPAGIHTIKITVDTVSGGGGKFMFDYWQPELVGTAQPQVLVANIARLPSYTAYTSLGEHVDDTSVALYNAQTVGVVAEFAGGKVQVFNMDAILNKDPANFAPDEVHPNNTGTALVGGGIFQVVGAL